MSALQVSERDKIILSFLGVRSWILLWSWSELGCSNLVSWINEFNKDALVSFHFFKSCRWEGNFVSFGVISDFGECLANLNVCIFRCHKWISSLIQHGWTSLRFVWQCLYLLFCMSIRVSFSLKVVFWRLRCQPRMAYPICLCLEVSHSLLSSNHV